MMLSRLILAFAAVWPQAALHAQTTGEPQQYRFELAAKPVAPGEIKLGTGPSGTPPEQWFLMNGELQVRNVNEATLTPFLPAPGKGTGIAVIVAPGGGFLGLAIKAEGYDIAKNLAEHGVAAFVLKYRVLPTPADLTVFGREMIAGRSGKPSTIHPPDDTPAVSLQDGQAALRLVRARAKEFGVDPDRVGMMGFSAGSFTILSLVRADSPDARPAFIAPIYGPQSAFPVAADAPPMFNLIAADDFLWSRGTGLIDAYRSAHRSVEFHMLAGGGHGFGIGRPRTATADWLSMFYKWLQVGPVSGSNR